MSKEIKKISLSDMTLKNIIFLNFAIVTEVMPWYFAKLPKPIAVIAWAIFAIFWLTIAWLATIIFELIFVIPNTVFIYVIRDEKHSYHDANGNWEPIDWDDISDAIGFFFGSTFGLIIGRVYFCFYALTGSLDQEQSRNCDRPHLRDYLID